MTPDETQELFRILNGAYPRWGIGADTIEIFEYAFEEISFEVVKRAVHRWVFTEEYPPTVAGLRKKCSEILGSNALLASEAWEEVTSEIRRVGRMGVPFFSDDNSAGVTRMTVESLGWGNICMSEKLDVIRGQFLRLYDERKDKVDKQTLSIKSLNPAIERIAKLTSTVVRSIE